jgi:hydrogenase/urease accessory protein HupE
MKRWSFLLLALYWPTPAWAHGSVPGLQGIYWGMLHPFTSGPQVLALFALALVIQQRLPDSEDVFHGFWASCLAGAGVAALNWIRFEVDIAHTIFAVVAGILTASALRLPLLVLMVLGICCGLPSGYLSWPDPGANGDMIFTALGGIIGSVLTVIAVAATVEVMWQATKWTWLPVAVRVAASWVTATAVLLSALMFRGPP